MPAWTDLPALLGSRAVAGGLLAELVLGRIVVEATPPAAMYGVWLPRACLAPELLTAARAALAWANEEEDNA